MSVHLDTDSTQLSPAVTHGRDVRVVVLSRDGALVSDIETALEGMHGVHHTRWTASLIDLLIECNAGVLITDMAERSAFQKLSHQLHQVSPNLLIVGVGERDAAEMLIESMNSGQVDIVMLRPLSPGRVRLQVQSAVRQHLLSREADLAAEAESVDREWDGDRTLPHSVEWLEEPTPEAPHAMPGRTRVRQLFLGGTIAGVLTAVVALTIAFRGGEAVGWRGPVGGSPVAVAGFEADADSSDKPKLAASAPPTLRESRYIAPDEGNALDHDQDVRPLERKNPSFGLVTAPDNLIIADERLDLTARMPPPESPEPGVPRASPASHSEPVTVRNRIALAYERIQSNNLSLPEDDSAMFHLLALKADDPEDEGVVEALEHLADIMLDLTDAAIVAEDFRTARRWLGKVETLGVRVDALTERRRMLASEEDAAAEAVLAAEAALTEAALDEELALAEAALAAVSLFEQTSRTDMAADSPDTVRGDAMGVRPVQVASISPVAIEPEAGAGAQIETALPEISEMRIVRMVEPEYPRRAYVRDIEGWIDVEFTVTKTGRTRAINVTGEQVPGWFGRAAVDAVEQWQFLPELRNGQPVERRAKVRLQFSRAL